MRRLGFLLILALGCGSSDTGGDDTPGGADAAPSIPATDDAAPRDDAAVPAAGTFEGDPEQDGPLSLTETAVSIPGPAGMIAATLYLPAGDGPFPLVVVMHGFTASHTLYASYSRHFASWGYAALGIDFTDDAAHEQNAKEAMAAIDWALDNAPIDAAKIATAGHSLGGKIAFFAAVLDPRIKAVIGWDPVDSGGPPCFIDPMGCHRWSVAPNSFEGDEGMMQDLQVATLIFAAPSGAFNPEEHHARRFWEGTKAPGLFVYFTSGDHLRWPNSEPEKRITTRTQIAWLARHFSRLDGVEPYLSGEIIQADVVAGTISILSK
jgi:acetyl esterase/lipase